MDNNDNNQLTPIDKDAVDTVKDAIDTVADMATGGDAKTFLAGLVTGAGITWAAIVQGAKLNGKK